MAIIIRLALSVGMVCFFTSLSFSADAKYIGAEKCKKCHKKEKNGAQYPKWQEGPHSKAYETLASNTAKIVAKASGVEGDPQKSPKCLECHVTAYGVDAAKLDSTYKITDGVGCESCHGPGSLYKKKKVMKDKDLSVAAGLIIPDEKVCTKCHNDKSPTFKEFNFEERAKKIAHPIPEGGRSSDKKE